jgi:nucleoside-diphosphate-sugar epimerase
MRADPAAEASGAKTVSVTGATGFLGWHLAEAFRDRGWRVRGVVRPGNAKPVPQGVDAIEASLDAAALARAIDGSAVVVHNAGMIRGPHPSAFEQVNVLGTRAAVDAANAAGARLILVSSLAAAGPGSPGRPCREADDPRPLTAYGRSKLAAEGVVRSCARVPWTILRPSAIYGPRDRGFLPLFRFAARGLFLQMAEPTAAFTLIYVDDAARAAVLAATEPRAQGETLFIGHRDAHRADDVLRQLADAFGRPFRPRRVPAAALRALALGGELWWKLGRQPMFDAARFTELRTEGFVCAVDRAHEILGFAAAVPLNEGVARTAQWYRERGWV